MANNDRFRALFKKHIAKAKDKTEMFAKMLAIDIDAALVMRSPVDTGRFRANWMVGIGAINTETFERFSDVSHEPLINSIKVNGQTIYITNSLPYAQRLEYGWSKQAPDGMVRLTVAEMSSRAANVGVYLRAF